MCLNLEPWVFRIFKGFKIKFFKIMRDFNLKPWTFWKPKAVFRGILCMHQAPICENRCCYFLKVGEVWQIWEFRDKEDLQKKLPVICKVKVTHYPFKNFHFEYNYESKFASMILTIVMILKFSSMVTFGWFTQKFSKERLLFYVNKFIFLCQ